MNVDQGLINSSPQAKSGLPSGFINKSLLECSYTHLFRYCLWLLLCYDSRVIQPASLKYLLFGPLQNPVCQPLRQTNVSNYQFYIPKMTQSLSIFHIHNLKGPVVYMHGEVSKITCPEYSVIIIHLKVENFRLQSNVLLIGPEAVRSYLLIMQNTLLSSSYLYNFSNISKVLSHAHLREYKCDLKIIF